MAIFDKCQRCKRRISKNSPAQKYCSECARLVHLEQVRGAQHRLRAERREARKRAEPDFLVCCDCGKQVERRSRNQQRCADCAKIRAKALKRQRYEERKKVNGTFKAVPVPPKKTATKSLAQMTQEARSLGLSYGSYTALLKSGMLETYCKTHGIKGEC